MTGAGVVGVGFTGAGVVGAGGTGAGVTGARFESFDGRIKSNARYVQK